VEICSVLYKKFDKGRIVDDLVQEFSPTQEVAQHLTVCFNHYNRKLFDGKLPAPLMTLNKSKDAKPAYFIESGARMYNDKRPRICLSPNKLDKLSNIEQHSWFVRMMIKQEWRQCFPKKKVKNNSYHDGDWAKLMRRVGLKPFGGKSGSGETGQGEVKHEVENNGQFYFSYRELQNLKGDRPLLLCVEIENEESPKNNKATYICETCGNKSWGKPGQLPMCGTCLQSSHPKIFAWINSKCKVKYIEKGR